MQGIITCHERDPEKVFCVHFVIGIVFKNIILLHLNDNMGNVIQTEGVSECVN